MYSEEILKIRLQLDGSIVAVGYASANGVTNHAAVARHLPDGSLDVSFGQDGKVFPALSGICRPGCMASK